MSTTLGFRYLYAADYIDREMDAWFHVSCFLFNSRPIFILVQERNLHYVVHIEVFLAKAFGFTPIDSGEEAGYALSRVFSRILG
jgi:rapamycin-insensitive companion of mTOR